MTHRHRWYRNPDAWAAILAAAALFISIWGWFDTRRMINLSAGQIRAYVQVVDARLVQPLDSTHQVQLVVSLKNLGQTAATDIHGEMDYRNGMPDTRGDGNEATRRSFPAMGPGMERPVVLASNHFQREAWPAPRQSLFETIYFYGTFWYRDDTTHENRHEDYCFKLPLKDISDLRRRDLQVCDNLNYAAKKDRW